MSGAWLRVAVVLGMLAVPLAAAVVTAVPAAAATTYTVTATIGVGSTPRGVGVDPATHTVYVANSGGNSVSVITSAISTSMTLASSGSPSTAGAPVTYTATITPVPDGGTVTFTDGATPPPGGPHRSARCL